MVSSPRVSLAAWNNMNEMLRQYALPEIPEQSLHNLIHDNWRKVFDLKNS
jgi:hypothetical protein